ncbi:hypothetical protein HY637_03955 [Candidatus Woesearchaeota archaeon]|nr:hypothetical protein [Candidatus Woesearchaeota archaeon]
MIIVIEMFEALPGSDRFTEVMFSMSMIIVFSHFTGLPISTTGLKNCSLTFIMNTSDTTDKSESLAAK